MKTRIFFLSFALFFLGTITILAQTTQDSTKVKIETRYGNEYVGSIVSRDDESLLINTDKLGEIRLKHTFIKTIQNISPDQIKNGVLWPENSQETRYFWSPNGFGLKAGEGYYQNIWVFWNQVAYGITDNFSVGGAVIPAFFVGGAPTPAFITGKLSVPVSEKVHLGGGAIAGTVIGASETGFGILYGLSTFGNRDKNFTLGVGYGFAGGDFSSTPLINFNGMIRVSRNGYFLTENYFISMDGESVLLISLGGRSIFKKAALDYGLFIPAGADMDVFIAIPWLGFTIPFGNIN